MSLEYYPLDRQTCLIDLASCMLAISSFPQTLRIRDLVHVWTALSFLSASYECTASFHPILTTRDAWSQWPKRGSVFMRGEGEWRESLEKRGVLRWEVLYDGVDEFVFIQRANKGKFSCNEGRNDSMTILLYDLWLQVSPSFFSIVSSDKTRISKFPLWTLSK